MRAAQLAFEDNASTMPAASKQPRAYARQSDRMQQLASRRLPDGTRVIGGPLRPKDGVVSRPPANAAVDPRTKVLLEGPIAATLVRLAWPNVLVMIVQASVGSRC